MKKLIASAALALGLLATPAVAEVSIKDAVGLLQGSVVSLKRGSEKFCTAFKVGSKKFLTAGHCAATITPGVKIDNNYSYQFIETILLPVAQKKRGRKHDWALLNTLTENTDLEALVLGCDEELYIGQNVASMGYPATAGRGQLDKSFVTGYISSLSDPGSSFLNQDIVVDMPAAPGASGSPVISLDTGAVVGILVELTTGSRSGSILTGIQTLPESLGDREVESNSVETEGKDYYDGLVSPF